MLNDLPVQPIYERVEATIRAAGLPVSDTMIRTILLRDRCFLGEKYRFDGGFAIWWAKEKTVQVFDDDGELLHTAEFPTPQEGQVA